MTTAAHRPSLIDELRRHVVAITLDATLVRGVPAPALVAALGPASWWWPHHTPPSSDNDT